MVEVLARSVYTGKTSLHVVVEVSASDPKDWRHTKTTHCVIVFVAVNDQGTHVDSSRWRPGAEEDKGLEQYTKRLVELRSSIEDQAADLHDKAVPR